MATEEELVVSTEAENQENGQGDHETGNNRTNRMSYH